ILTINLGDDLGVPVLSKDLLTITDVNLGTANLIVNGEDGKDEVKFVGTNTAGDVQVNAEKIDLSSSTLNAANVTLTADELENDAEITGGVFLALPSAEIDLTGATLSASGAVQLTATATADMDSSTFTLGPVGGALFTVLPSANITMSDTTVTAASLSAESKVVVDMSGVDTADSTAGDTDEQSDAAIAVAVIVSDATTSVDGATAITTTGAVSLKATSDINVVSNADGGSDTSAKGGTVAVTDLHATTKAFVSDSASITAGGDVDVLAEFGGDVTTTAKSTAGGAQASAGGTNESEMRLQDANQDGMTTDSAQTAESGGSLGFAGAVGVVIYAPTTQAYIDSSGAVTTTGGSLDVGASATDKVSLTADGSNTGSSATGVGVGAAGLYGDSTTHAYLAGSGDRNATGGITVGSTLASGDTYGVEAKSGVGDASSVGFAGALAINIALTSVEALVKTGTTSNFGTSDLTLEASSTTKAVTKATADANTDGTATGVGPSVAFVYGNNDTRAAIETDATVNTTGDITVSATGKHKTDTEADGGAAGGQTGVTPVAATSVPINDTIAEVQSGTGLTPGDLTIKAKQTSETSTLAKGATAGSNLAFGLSFGLTIQEDTVVGRLNRDVASTGAVSVSAAGASATSTEAKASAQGTETSGGGSSPDATTQNQVNHANTQASNNSGTSTGTSSAPNSNTSSGAVAFAAAVGVNLPSATATAAIAGTDITPITVSAAGAGEVKSSANTDSEAIADGKAKTTSGGTAVGAGVAVNAPGTTNMASIADANVTADGVTIAAGMTERKLDLDAVTTVDTGADTIFVGDAAGLTTGEEVTYSNGGGGNIGNLNNGGTYYVIKGSNKRIKLADSLANAEAGTAVDLTTLGSGDSHKILRPNTPADDDITFDPDKLRLEVGNDAGLNTGDALLYDNGGGSDIGGLTDDTTYYAIVDGDKQVRLAETRDKAYKGDAIDITGAGTGEDHTIADTTHSGEAQAISGASGGDTGVAGSVAINIASGTTKALADDGALLTSQDGAVDGDTDAGDVKISADSTTHNQALALPNEDPSTGTSLGAGLSFAFNLSTYETRAKIDGGAEITTTGNVSVMASSDHAMFTKAKAGVKSTSGTGLAGAIAIAVANNSTIAEVPGDTNVLQIGGNLVIQATSAQDQRTEGDADTKGGQTGVGVAFATGWVLDETNATLGRDIGTVGDHADDVTVSATATVEATTVANASSEGSKKQSNGGSTADQTTQNQTNYANSRSGSSVSSPAPGSQVSGANTQASNQTSNPGGQNNANANQATKQTQGSTVRVAAAIGATVFLSTSEASILDNVDILADGDTTVVALMDADANTQAIALSMTKDKNATTVGAAVAINVAQLAAMALVGEASITAGSLKVQAGNSTDKKNELKALALAGGGSTQRGEGDNTAVAGAAAVNVYLTDASHRVEASIADNATVTSSSGNVDLLARQDVGVQTIAGGGALTLSDSGTSVGAAIGVNFIDTTTLASIGDGATVNASGNVSVVADASITPLEIVTPEIEGIDAKETGVDVTTLIIGAAIGSGGDAGAGSAAIDIFNTNTRAWIGSGASITAADVTVQAVNDTKVDSFVGALALSKDSTGVGVGLDVMVVTKTTEAWIAASNDAGTPTMVDASGNVTVDADSSEDLWSLTVNAGAGTSTSAAGGLIVMVNITTTRAFVGLDPDAPLAGNVTLDADGSVVIAADSTTDAELYAGTLGLSMSGSSVGISIGILVDIDETSSFIGDGASITARGNGAAASVRDGMFDGDGNQGSESVRGVAVTATSYDDMTVLAIAASGSLGRNNSGEENMDNDGGTNVGIAASVGVAVIHGATKATLGAGAAINSENTGADAGQGILVRAADETNILNIVGGLTITLGGGDPGITGSVSVDEVENTVWARALGGNTLNSAGGGVRFSATGATNIDTITIAVAGVANTGSSQNNNNSSSVSFAGAGSVTVNIVENEFLAQIEAGSTVNTTGDLSLTAEDDTVISADSGGVAVAIDPSNTDGSTAGAIGASVAVNDISQTIKATVTDTPITAADVTASATNSAEIHALTIAGSAAVSNSSDAFAGAGSGSGNFISSETEASITNPGGTQIVTSSGNVAITATDESQVDADAGSGALAVSLNGGDLGAIAIGAAAAENHITRTTTAALQNVDATAAGNVAVSATATGTISAFTLGIAGALSGEGPLAAAGAGSGSGNFISSTTSATIDPSTVNAGGNVSVAATDSSSITATAGALTASINVDSGTNVGVGLGIAIAINEITSSATAIIDDTTVNAGGAVDVAASSSGSINAVAFGASLSIASSSDGTAAGLSANVAVTKNTINFTTRAAIEDSAPGTPNTVNAGGAVTLSATDSGAILADAVSATLNFAFGSSSGNSISGGIGVSVALNTINSNTEAIIDDVDVTAGGDVGLLASSSKDIDALVLAASVAVSVGSGSGNSVSISGAGAGATNTTNNSVNAIIRAAEVS
ncbi:MAG: hypothetical protein PVJ49_14220, partial [Acidobacteriota bacterium]